MYDITSVFTTIASCSASIVAILGGFIASKLIALNAERDEVENRILELNEEIEFFINERNELQYQLDENDALEFINDNIEDIVNGKEIGDVYKEEEHPLRSKDVISPFWNRAIQVVQIVYEYVHECDDDKYEENEDGVPLGAAKRITDDFEYDVAKKICDFIKRQNATFPYLNTVTGGTGIWSGKWYTDTTEKVMSADNKISYLTLQKKQYEARSKALENPKGMKQGLILFAVFSMINIVLPLCMLPFAIDDHKCYLCIKIIIISLFFVGLLCIMCYLIYLLKWKKKDQTTGVRK